MPNDTALVSAIPGFVSEAKGVGIYNGSQATNLQQALKLALEQAKLSGVDTDKVTIAQARESYDVWLDDYGGKNRASVHSIATYKGRVKKLLDDFTTWNDGNFMEWKKTIAKAPKQAARKPKAKETEEPAPQSNNGHVDTDGAHEHVFRLPSGKTGKLTLPDPIKTSEIKAAWKVLDAYKTLLEAQAEVDDEVIDEGEAKIARKGAIT
jgi:hypothetical protein